MLHYLAQWGHMYVVHFGAWMTFAFGATIYKEGLLPLKELPGMLKTAVVIASVLSVFSSHSHHYFKNVVPETKITHAGQDH